MEHDLFIQQLFLYGGEYKRRGQQGQHQFLHDWVTGMDTLAPQDWAWDELAAFLSLGRLQPVNLLLSTYCTMGAVRHGEHVAKVRVAPAKESAEKVVRRLLDPMSARDIYRPALVSVCACQLQRRVWPPSSHTRTSPRLLAAAQYCPLLLMATNHVTSKVSGKTLSLL